MVYMEGIFKRILCPADLALVVISFEYLLPLLMPHS